MYLYPSVVVTASRYGISEVPVEVANLVSHATQERLRHIMEKLSTIADQRTEIYKVQYPCVTS